MEIVKTLEKRNAKRGEPQGLQLMRQLATRRFESLGWPQKQNENWKYSPISRLKKKFEYDDNSNDNVDENQGSVPDKEQIRAQWSSSGFHLILLFNGRLIHQDNDLLPSLEIRSLKDAIEQGWIHFSSMDDIDDPLEALNLADLQSGLHLRISDNSVLDKPIHCIHLFSTKQNLALYQNYLHIEGGKSSSATIIESSILLSSGETLWCNSKTHLSLQEKAHLNYIHWNELSSDFQITHTLSAETAREAYLHHLEGALGSGWSRTKMSVLAKGEKAEIISHSLGLTKGTGVSEFISKFSFLEPSSTIEQRAKNLLFESSKAVFNGCIHINQKAQKTEASQLHQSLLLSEGSEVDTKPELEIFADDVKAKHGATVGQLNPDELFYFQSRGINKERARTILCTAFLLELCDRFPQAILKNYLSERIQSYWKKENL